MLENNQDRKDEANAPRMGRTRRLGFILKEEAPKDFLEGVGVLVAVKNPVSTSVVVTVTLAPPAAVGVADEAMELQSEDALYRTPLIMTPRLWIIMFF
jgi:cell division protein FtsX